MNIDLTAEEARAALKAIIHMPIAMADPMYAPAVTLARKLQEAALQEKAKVLGQPLDKTPVSGS